MSFDERPVSVVDVGLKAESNMIGAQRRCVCTAAMSFQPAPSPVCTVSAHEHGDLASTLRENSI